MIEQRLKYLADDVIEAVDSYARDPDSSKMDVARNRLLTLIAAMIEAPSEVRHVYASRLGHLDWCDVWRDRACSTNGLCEKVSA